MLRRKGVGVVGRIMYLSRRGLARGVDRKKNYKPKTTYSINNIHIAHWTSLATLRPDSKWNMQLK